MRGPEEGNMTTFAIWRQKEEELLVECDLLFHTARQQSDHQLILRENRARSTFAAPKRIWHYTTGHCLAMILKDGVIRPATAGIDYGESPTVWEPTANKALMTADGRSIRLSRSETERHGRGLARIEADPEVAPYTWEDFRRISGVSPATARGLKMAAKRWGSDPGAWRVSLGPVLRSEWLAVEVWRDRNWTPLDDQDPREMIDAETMRKEIA